MEVILHVVVGVPSAAPMFEVISVSLAYSVIGCVIDGVEIHHRLCYR